MYCIYVEEKSIRMILCGHTNIHWNTKYNCRYISNVSQHDMELRKLGLCNRLQCKLGY